MKASDITAFDGFCGAGGSTTGLKQAGIRVVHAANHWSRAIESHNTNHPEVDHSCVDLNLEHPAKFPNTTIAWMSPSCTTHSPAGGRKRLQPGQLHLWEQRKHDPAVERSRMGAWDVVNFSEFHRYQSVIVENVLEFSEWELFDVWLDAMHKLGYRHQIICFNSQFSDDPVPQSRDRIYVVFSRKKNRLPDVNFNPRGQCIPCGKEVACVQAWKNPTKRIGRYKFQYIYTCPECGHEVIPYRKPASAALDWNLPCPRIGDRKRPLSPNTIRRVRKGLERFVEPFLTAYHGGRDAVQPVSEPSWVVATNKQFSMVVPPFIDTLRNNAVPKSTDEPATTVTAQGNHHALVTPPKFLTSYYSNGGNSLVAEPSPTICTVQGQALIDPDWDMLVESCGYRMIQAHEAKRLMGFPDDYVLLGNQEEQFKQAGNAVTPPVAAMLARAVVEALS